MVADTASRESLLAEIGALNRRVAALETECRELLNAERVLRQSRERFRRLLESVTDYIYTVVVRDGQPVATEHGPNCLAVTGYTAAEYRENPLLWLAMVPEGDRPLVLDHARRVLAGENVGPFEHRIIHKDGSVRHVRNTMVVHRDAVGNVVSYDGIVNDMTERRRAEELIAGLSLHDGLTGLPNRALYMDRLRQTLDQAERAREIVAVYFIDLDHFKEVNDLLGHEAGDKVLATAAKRLAGCVRRADTVARLGGDEFVALTPGVGSPARAEAIAQKFVDVMQTPFTVRGRQCHVGASVGVALFPQHGRRGGELLRLADAAMYAAKHAGRNRWCMAPAAAPET